MLWRRNSHRVRHEVSSSQFLLRVWERSWFSNATLSFHQRICFTPCNARWHNDCRVRMTGFSFSLFSLMSITLSITITCSKLCAMQSWFGSTHYSTTFFLVCYFLINSLFIFARSLIGRWQCNRRESWISWHFGSSRVDHDCYLKSFSWLKLGGGCSKILHISELLTSSAWQSHFHVSVLAFLASHMQSCSQCRTWLCDKAIRSKIKERDAGRNRHPYQKKKKKEKEIPHNWEADC